MVYFAKQLAKKISVKISYSNSFLVGILGWVGILLFHQKRGRGYLASNVRFHLVFQNK